MKRRGLFTASTVVATFVAVLATTANAWLLGADAHGQPPTTRELLVHGAVRVVVIVSWVLALLHAVHEPGARRLGWLRHLMIRWTQLA